MSGISSATTVAHTPATPPTRSTAGASSTRLVTAEAAARIADAASVKAAAQIATDRQTKVTEATLQADQKAATTEQAAAAQADAVVTTDENSSGVNVTA